MNLVPNSSLTDIVIKKRQYTDTQKEGAMCQWDERQEGCIRKPGNSKATPLPPLEAGRGSADTPPEGPSLRTSESTIH